MGVVAALLDSRQAVQTLRRSLPKTLHRSIVCRYPSQLIRALETRLLDGIVLGPKAAAAVDLPTLRPRFPKVPLVAFGPFRPTHAPLLLDLAGQFNVACILVEGLDDAVVGLAIDRESLTCRRVHALRDGRRVLRLIEPLQAEAWDQLVRSAGRPPSATNLAKRLRVSREHLSRQFGAGGAPNLKRVMDFLRVVAARDLVANPGYDTAMAASILGFSSATHFRQVTRRVVGTPAADLARLGIPELLRRFRRVGRRSRT